MTQLHFNSFNLLEDIINQIKKVNYTQPTPIQEQAIPVILEGHDVLGQAQTGTGKTAAFIIPIINNIALNHNKKCLILSPTRELAIQTYEFSNLITVDKVIPICCYGGSAYSTQIQGLKRGANIIVGTPGRIIDLVNKNYINISDLSVIVLDEADQMFNMGFLDDITFLLDQISDQCQRLLFSATFSNEIINVSKSYLRNPKTIRVESKSSTANTISQNYALVERNKEDAIDIILDLEEFVDGVIVFANTKQETIDFCNAMKKKSRSVSFINGDMTQSQREKVISDFKNKKFSILIATDVAARGLDIDHITHVFQLELPFDVEPYVHRIGRTGRIGRLGKSVVFISRRNEHAIDTFSRKLKCNINKIELLTSDELVQKRTNDIINNLNKISQDKDLSLFNNIIEQNELCSNPEIVSALFYYVQLSKPIFLNSNHFLSIKSSSSIKPTSRYNDRNKDSRDSRYNRSNIRQRSTDRERDRYSSGSDSRFLSFKITGGKNTNLSVNDILEDLDKMNIHRYNIGRITLGDTTSVVQIKSTVPDFILNNFKRRYNGSIIS